MKSKNVTILGGSGYIGSLLATSFKNLGYSVWTPKRDDNSVFEKDLGLVYYCIGLTSDFRTRPYETIDAHIGFLRKILEMSNFDKIIYLSSTRVYINSNSTDESHPLLVNPNTPSDLYNISKLMGESLVFSSDKKFTIARISNVVGPGMSCDNFIGLLLKEAKYSGELHFQTSKDSKKDYIWIDDVIESLIRCKNDNLSKIYNICSGVSISNLYLASVFKNNGINVTFEANAPKISFIDIDNNSFKKDAGYSPGNCSGRLESLISDEITKWNNDCEH